MKVNPPEGPRKSSYKNPNWVVFTNEEEYFVELSHGFGGPISDKDIKEAGFRIIGYPAFDSWNDAVTYAMLSLDMGPKEVEKKERVKL